MGKRAKTAGELSKAIGETISNFLEEKEISQNQLAEKSTVSQPRVNRTLTGKAPMYVDELAAMARALDLKPSEIIATAEASLRKPSPSSPVMLSEAEAYKIAEELDRKLRAGMTPEQLGLAAKTREIDPLDARGEESQIPPDWDE